MSRLPINIPEVCGTIRRLCEEEPYAYQAVKQDLFNHIQVLKMGLLADLILSDLQAVLTLHRSLFDLKGHKAGFAETEMAKDLLFRVPLMIRMNSDEDPWEEDEVIDLEEGLSQSFQNPSFHIGAELAAHVVHICNRPAEKSKRYLKRLTEGIKLLSQLQETYPISGTKPIYWSQVKAKDENLQFSALNGLEDYYDWYEDSLTSSEQAVLKGIINSTDRQFIAATCCRVFVNAEEMNQMEVMAIMNRWRERNGT